MLKVFDEYFAADEFLLPQFGETALKAGHLLGDRLLAGVIRHAAQIVSRQFLAGHSESEVFARISVIERQGRQVSLDRVGEVTLSEPEAKKYLQAYLDLISASTIDPGRHERSADISSESTRSSNRATVGATRLSGRRARPSLRELCRFDDIQRGGTQAVRQPRGAIFGPVLTVILEDSVDQALTIANNTSYALTGGVYSRSLANLRRAAAELPVGNCYRNREITGALVARQPFGGPKLSGLGSKAGGPDYLLQFMESRRIAENTLRRGVASS